MAWNTLIRYSPGSKAYTYDRFRTSFVYYEWVPYKNNIKILEVI